MSNGTILLHRHLNGETLAEHECAELSAWVCASPDHAKLAAELTCLDQTILADLRHRASAPLVDAPADEEADLIDQTLRRDAYAPEIMQELVAQAQAKRADAHRALLDAPIQMQAEPTRRFTASDARWVAGKVMKRALLSKTGAVSAVAAVLLLAVVLVVSLNNETQPPVVAQAKPAKPMVVATLTATHNAQWAEGALAPGSQLPAGHRLTLTQGFAEITTKRGAIAILQAPAAIELTKNYNALRLHSGKLVGICETDSSKGFLVRTPHMDITDLGTRFGVDVARGLATEVHVSQGEVVVAQPPSNGTTQPVRQHLTANQAIRCDAFNHALASITPAFEKFGPALGTYSLRSTGLGLAEGEVDPHWQVVADANGPLKAPLPLVVQYSYSKKHPHYPAPNNDPDIAQWLFFAATGPSNYYPFPPTEGLDPTRLTLESRFDLPDLAQFQGQVLHLRFATPEPALSLQINGQTITPQPKYGKKDGKIVYHELDIPIDQAALKPGENLIRVELTDHTNRDIASFYLDWEIRPASEPTRSPGSQAP